MKRIFIWLALSVLLFSTSCSNCDKLPTSFKSYDEATTLIDNARFSISESVNTDKSSWITGAKFKSCDGEKGFLIVEVGSREYIHQNVPRAIWESFKKASSFGSFYNSQLKNGYQLQIK